MADNGFNGERQFPYPLTDTGKGYDLAVQSRATAILSSLQGFLASNYRATIPSPEYATFLRSIAFELAKFTVGLEDLSADIDFGEVRPEFLFQTVGYYIFRDGDLPDLELTDEAFREFLLTIIEIFFQGSTPESIRDAVRLFTDENFTLKENFIESRSPTSPLDISDQFGFTVEFDLENGQFPPDLFTLQDNINLLIKIVKPAHTLFTVSYLFQDVYPGPEDENGDPLGSVQDEVSLDIVDRRYEDVRRYCKGMAGWVATTGFGTLGSLFTFRDEAVSSPLSSVRVGATLTITSGPNSGVYRVTGNVDDNAVTITPRLNEPETDISYKIEVDRLGKNQEVFVQGEVATDQFKSPIIFQIELDGPYSVAGGGMFTATAVGNFSGDVTYEWDFGDGDNEFNNGTGSSVTFTAPVGPAERLVRVKGTTADGRVRVAQAAVTIT